MDNRASVSKFDVVGEVVAVGDEDGFVEGKGLRGGVVNGKVHQSVSDPSP